MSAGPFCPECGTCLVLQANTYWVFSDEGTPILDEVIATGVFCESCDPLGELKRTENGHAAVDAVVDHVRRLHLARRGER